VEQISSLITEKLAAPYEEKYKAITALVPYAIFLGRGGHQGMIDAILDVITPPDFGKLVWKRVTPYLTTLFDESSPPPLDRAVTLMAPYVPWDGKLHDRHTVAKWAAAALAVPYTEDIGCSVVNALLQIAFVDSLRPHIPIELWAWLKKLPPLPPMCPGLFVGRKEVVVRYVRQLGDIEILKSYFLLIWSEWNFLFTSGLDEMRISVGQDFCAIESKQHREDLLERLDYVLGELDRGFGYIVKYKPGIDQYQLQRAKLHYRTLREVLLGVEREFRGFVRWILSSRLSPHISPNSHSPS
jgi:hypothetical protein